MTHFAIMNKDNYLPKMSIIFITYILMTYSNSPSSQNGPEL